ncbi:MAG: hypothetical protein HOV79_01325 [Hamadaea sp.]|nr:hypothetical protein [Hamadaea sp.]
MTKATGFLRPAAIVTAIAGGVAALAGAALQGVDGALGAAAGVALVLVSYLLSTLVIAWVERVNRSMLFVVGMGLYAIKFTLLFLVVGWVAGVDWDGTRALAVGVLVGVLAWTGTQIWWTSKAKFTLEV